MATHQVYVFECDYCGKRTKPRTELPKGWRRLHGKYEVCPEHKNIGLTAFVKKILGR